MLQLQPSCLVLLQNTTSKFTFCELQPPKCQSLLHSSKVTIDQSIWPLISLNDRWPLLITFDFCWSPLITFEFPNYQFTFVFFSTLTSFLHIIAIFFKKRMSRLSLCGNFFRNPVELITYSPISRHVNRKRYLTSFLHIVMMIFQKTLQLSLWGNSFRNLVKTNSHLPIFLHVNRKRFLMSFLPIIMIFY